MPEMLKVSSCALLIHAHPGTIRKWIRNGQVIADTSRKPWRVDRDSLLGFAKHRIVIRPDGSRWMIASALHRKYPISLNRLRKLTADGTLKPRSDIVSGNCLYSLEDVEKLLEADK
jgi:hypothetical protein